jgi:hypothetical protein
MRYGVRSDFLSANRRRTREVGAPELVETAIMFALKFDKSQIPEWASRYDGTYDEHVERVVAPRVRAVGYFTTEDFIDLCVWKETRQRTRKAWKRNDEEYIRAVTGAALATKNEQFALIALTCLEGIRGSIASAMLHWAHADCYPIIHKMAALSLGVTPADMVLHWPAYIHYCRDLADECGVSMRDLDRALYEARGRSVEPTLAR